MEGHVNQEKIQKEAMRKGTPFDSDPEALPTISLSKVEATKPQTSVDQPTNRGRQQAKTESLQELLNS